MRSVALACALLAAAVLVLADLPLLARAALIVLAAIALWSTGAIPEHVTALLFFLLVLVGGVAPPGVVFSGFASPAFWLIFGGLIVGVAAQRSGLASRLASALIGRARAGYVHAAATMVAIGIAITFVMPSSMGRVVMLIPIAIAYADRLGFGHASSGRTGIVLAAAFGAYLPSAGVLPANLPNIILAAGAEQLYGIHFTYAGYFVSAFPVLGLLKAAAIVALVALLFGEPPGIPRRVATRTPWSPSERAVGLVLAASLAFWTTDFLHGISPAWIALAAAIVCMLPLTRLFSRENFATDVSHVALLHAAGIIGLGSVVAESGLGDAMGRAIVPLMPFTPDASTWNFMVLSAFSTLVCMVTTTPGVPAVLTPLAGALSEATGLSLNAVFLSQIVGFTNPLLPYESAPIVFALHYAGIPLRHLVLAMLALGAITLVFLAPLAYLWMALIGGAVV